MEGGGGCDGVWGRFMGDVYYYTVLPRGGEEDGWGERGKTVPFPFYFFPYTGDTPGVESRRAARGSSVRAEMLD